MWATRHPPHIGSGISYHLRGACHSGWLSFAALGGQDPVKRTVLQTNLANSHACLTVMASRICPRASALWASFNGWSAMNAAVRIVGHVSPLLVGDQVAGEEQTRASRSSDFSSSALAEPYPAC